MRVPPPSPPPGTRDRAKLEETGNNPPSHFRSPPVLFRWTDTRYSAHSLQEVLCFSVWFTLPRWASLSTASGYVQYDLSCTIICFISHVRRAILCWSWYFWVSPTSKRKWRWKFLYFRVSSFPSWRPVCFRRFIRHVITIGSEVSNVYCVVRSSSTLLYK